MKLYKAVEKVKQQNNASPRSTAATDNGSTSIAGRPFAKDLERTMPVYSQSRFLPHDEKTACDNRCVCAPANEEVLTYYKVLRTRLMSLARSKGWNTIMITSMGPGEGKSLTAVNLALTFAKSYNQTVMLVDCDLHQQNVHRYLGIDSDMGIADCLVDGVPLNQLIVWPGIEQLTLISGERTIPDTVEVLASPRMKELMREMKERYADRMILVDAPPLLCGADALVLAELVDGIVIVVENGKTTHKEIKEGLALVPKEKFIGFVLNKHSTGYRYYYSSYAEQR